MASDRATLPDFAQMTDGAHRRTLPDGRRVFIKIRRGMPPDFFHAEAAGLAALAARGVLRVPAIFHADVDGIALEDLGSGSPSPSDWRAAGHGLAQLHQWPTPSFGFDTAGYCGDSPQDNTRDADGFRFFAERRLLPQMRRALASRLIDGDDGRRIERVCERLPQWLPASPPVLVHGDLWTGNLHACADGGIALIDGAAVHHGWALGDLAMATLFGEPPPEFFAAYEAASGIDSNWREHAPLLNLYHLLNHANLFGASYISSVRRVLRRYA